MSRVRLLRRNQASVAVYSCCATEMLALMLLLLQGQLLLLLVVASAVGHRRRCVNREYGVQNRIDSAVEKSNRVGECEDELRDGPFILGPDVDEMNDEIWRPTDDEQADQ